MATTLLRPLLFAASLAVLSAAPTLADDSETTSNQTSELPTAKPYPTGIQCAWVPDPFGYGVIDEKHMILDGSASRKYLITFMSSCHGLHYALGIGLERHGSQICSGDAVLAGNDRCVIRYIEKVKDAREGAAIVQARAAAEEKERKNKSDR